MESIISISVFVLILVAVIEGYSLFSEVKSKNKNKSFAVILPVFSDDFILEQRLYEISEKLKYSNPDISDSFIIVNYSGTPEQLKIARTFCFKNNMGKIIAPDELEKNLSEIFAINMKK